MWEKEGLVALTHHPSEVSNGEAMRPCCPDQFGSGRLMEFSCSLRKVKRKPSRPPWRGGLSVAGIYLLAHLELLHLQWSHLVHLELVWERSAQCQMAGVHVELQTTTQRCSP